MRNLMIFGSMICFVLLSEGAWSQGNYDNNTVADTSFATAFGSNNVATGINSFACGSDSKATGNNSFASGASTASGNYSFASGAICEAGGDFSRAFGAYVSASGAHSTAIGAGIGIKADFSIGLGYAIEIPDSATKAIVIGSGILDGFLKNPIPNSLAIGFNSDIPTLFVEPSNGLGTTGNVGIGTTTPQNKLDINGTARAKEIRVESGWGDYVFQSDHQIPTLDEEAQHIQEKGHLSGFQSAKEMKGEIQVGDVTKRQQVKIEEVVLHLIKMNKEIQQLKEENTELKKEVEQLKQH